MQNRLDRGLTGDREASWGTVAVVQVRDEEMGMTIGDRCKSNLGIASAGGVGKGEHWKLKEDLRLTSRFSAGVSLRMSKKIWGRGEIRS